MDTNLDSGFGPIVFWLTDPPEGGGQVVEVVMELTTPESPRAKSKTTVVAPGIV